MKKKPFLLFLLFVFSGITVFSQIIETGKIKSYLDKNIEDSLKIKIYEYLSKTYYYNSYDSAVFFIEKAISLAGKKSSPQKLVKLMGIKAEYYVENGHNNEALQLNNDILGIYRSLADIGGEGKAMVNKGVVYDNLGDYHSALICYDSAMTIANKVNDKKVIALANNRYGIIYEEMSQFHKAIEYYKKSLVISTEINFENEIKNSYNYLGISYYLLGDYQHSLEYYQKYLDWSEKHNALKDIAFAYGNIGMIYESTKNFDKALFFYQKSLAIHQQINNKSGIANSLTSLGDIEYGNMNYDLALKYFVEVLNISEELNDIRAKSFIYGNIGKVYHKQLKYKEAIENYILSLELSNKLGDIGGEAWNYLYLGVVNYDMKKFPEAFKYFEKSYKAGLITGEKEVLKGSTKYLSDIYNQKGDFKNAYHFLDLFKIYSDSLVNADKIREITELDIKYQNDKERQLEKLQQQQKDLEFQQKLAKQKVFRNSFILGFAFMFVIAIVIFRNLKHKQKLNTILKQQRGEILNKNEELSQMNHEIIIHNEIISKRNTNITDSLKYAQKIQSALFPQHQLLKTYFADGFIMHRPLEIVSGDFYWIKKINSRVVLAVADCTGHGVPGAFMSVLGIAYLNEISREKQNQKTGEILDKLRLELKHSIEHSEYRADTKDGMDIALCAINKDDLTAQFSGATNDLILIRDNNLVVYKGDHQHIGIYDEEKRFTNFGLQLQKEDILYMFTDGYVDQFGGANGSKFLIKNFKQLLLEISPLPMEEQKTVLEKTLNKWQSNHQQVDDILVMGIKI